VLYVPTVGSCTHQQYQQCFGLNVANNISEYSKKYFL
jgi:hypothetical protein